MADDKDNTLLQVLGVGDVFSMFPCKIDCSHFVQLGDKAADPVDCHKYYFCYASIDHSDTSFSCPSGEDFDTNTKECMSPSTPGFKCTPSCEKCSFDCASAVLNKAANLYDCSVYYECDLMGLILETKQCESSAPYFDGNKCQSQRDKCCTCRPICSAGDVAAHEKVRDHRNCTNFYLCIAPGIPDESTHGHCNAGNFNAEMGECQEGAPCVAACQKTISDSDCGEDFVCEKYGNFPKCTTSCDPHYYHCSLEDVGRPVEAKVCTRNNVIDPYQVLCVPPEECPCPCTASKKTPRTTRNT